MLFNIPIFIIILLFKSIKNQCNLDTASKASECLRQTTDSDYCCFITFLNEKISAQNEDFDIYIKSIKNSDSIIFKTLFNFEKGRIYYFSKDDNKNSLNLYFINVINNNIEFYCFSNISKSIKLKNN